MAQEIEINESASVMVYGSAIATFENTPKQPVNRELRDTATEKIALWGTSNDLPQLMMTELGKNPDLRSYLHLQARALYSGGIDYELVDPLTEKPLAQPKSLEINQFLRKNWHYPIQATEDFYRFYNFFPQMTVGDNRKKIIWLIGREANYCRLENEDNNGKINKCYVNANWPTAKPEDPETLKIPTINPILDSPKSLRARKDGPHYIYAMSYPTGESYYSIPNWWGLKQSKWLELANKIPAFKLALMNNQVTIKYHIQFPDYFWEWKYPNWKNLKSAEKKAVKEAEIKMIVDYLQGAEKAGKSLVTGYKFDEHHGKEYPGIKIDAIDDKIKDGIYLEDSAEATIKIFSALGLDPSILGVIPGKGGSNRSGSDKREAILMYLSLIQPHVDLILRPYEFIADYNGWNNDTQLVKWRFKARKLETLDKITPAKRESMPNHE